MSKINIDINIVVNNKEANNALDETKRKEKELKEQTEKPLKIVIQTEESLSKIKELEKVEKDLEKQIIKKKELKIDTYYAENDLNKVKSSLKNLGQGKINTDSFKNFGNVLKNDVGSSITGLVSSIPLIGSAISTAFGPLLPVIVGVAGGIAILKSSFDNLTSQELRVDRLSTALQITREEAANLDKELRDNAISDGGDVDEYREAYIKLANQGINATASQMTQLQALAKQSGRSIEDVADAVAGAKRGETDALGELIGEFEVDGGKIVSSIEGVTAESTKMLDFVSQVLEQKGIGKVLEEDSEAIGPVFGRIAGKFSAMWEDLMTSDGMKSFISTLLSITETISEYVIPYVGYLFRTLGHQFNILYQIIRVIVSIIAQPFILMYENVKLTFSLIGKAYDYLVSLFKSNSDSISKTFLPITNAIDNLLNYFKKVSNDIADFFSDLFKPFFDSLDVVFDFLGDSIDFVLDKLSFLKPLVDNVYKSIKPTIDAIIGLFDGVADLITNTLEFLGIVDKVEKNKGNIDKNAGETDIENKDKDKDKEEEKKKEVKDKAAKADSDRRKSALAEAEKLIKKEVDTALFELERKVIEGKVLEEDAAAQKILIEEQANVKILELAKKLANEKSNLFKLEKDEVEKHTYSLLQIQRKYELELLKLSQKNLDLAIDALNKQLDLKKSLIEKDTDEQIKTLKHQQDIRKINGTETKKTEQETSDAIFNLRREAVYKQIELEEEKVARLKVLGVDYVADYEEMYDKIRDINREQQKETEENTKKEKDKLFEFLSEVSGQFGEVGGHFAKIFKGIDDFLKADKMADKVAAIGEVAKATVAAFVDLVSQINQMQIDKLDAEIEKRKENIDKIKEETEAILERDLTIAEIENKLAEQRIEELEALQEQLPEAQKERAEKDIETERAKIQNLGEIKDNSQKQEERRIKKEERAIEQAEKKKRQLQAETFEVQKQGAIITTLINTAVAIIQSYAQLPLPAAIAASIIITALGATQVALIASQENPYRLAKGTLDTNLLRHAGAKQGEDSIPALLMPGEAVIPTSTSKKYSKSIEAIFNERIPSSVLNNFVLEYLDGGTNRGNQLNVINNNINADGIIKAIRDKESVRLNIDEDGLSKYVIKTNMERKVMNKKLRKDV